MFYDESPCVSDCAIFNAEFRTTQRNKSVVVFRWRPTTEAIGVPHVAAKEDRYEGMYIPKGTMCMCI
ncbi:hypothetical protein F5888DRAFT_1708897 [Russula emetica]|nr:hypothetical protein F5888DRAFT_1754514 [Russula emetica]KAF8495658.1 hypothetical protein F5888DRAFT_1708897 [Russula emetica]